MKRRYKHTAQCCPCRLCAAQAVPQGVLQRLGRHPLARRARAVPHAAPRPRAAAAVPAASLSGSGPGWCPGCAWRRRRRRRLRRRRRSAAGWSSLDSGRQQQGRASSLFRLRTQGWEPQLAKLNQSSLHAYDCSVWHKGRGGHLAVLPSPADTMLSRLARPTLFRLCLNSEGCDALIRIRTRCTDECS